MARPPKVGGARGKHIEVSSEPAEPDSPEGSEPTLIEGDEESGAAPERADDDGAVEPFYQGGPTGIEIDPEAEEKVRASLALLLDSLGHLSEEMLEAARTFLTQGDANADPPSPGGLLVDMQVQLWWLARELGLDVKAELEKRLTAFNRRVLSPASTQDIGEARSDDEVRPVSRAGRAVWLRDRRSDHERSAANHRAALRRRSFGIGRIGPGGHAGAVGMQAGEQAAIAP